MTHSDFKLPSVDQIQAYTLKKQKQKNPKLLCLLIREQTLLMEIYFCKVEEELV